MKKWVVLMFVASCYGVHGQAPVADFKLPNVVDGGTVSLSSYPTCSALAIVFTSNACPYDGYYTARIKDLIDTYQGKIQFILVNSFQEPEENVDKMKTAYARWGLPVPYLADKDQSVLNALGARKSPEVFLLKESGGKYNVVYNGAIDDNPQMASAATRLYLRSAIDKTLAGQKPDAASVRPTGCSIRKK
jgi:peroxiredoxin